MASVAVRLGGLYGGYFLFLGLFSPYWPLWLKSHGLGIEVIGWLVALTQILKVMSAPLIAQLSDLTGRRRVILLTAALLSPLLFGLFGLAQTVWALFLVTALLHLVLPAIMPLSEQMALAAARRGELDYGRTRAVGSLTFLVAAYVGGVVIAVSSVNSLFWMLWAALGLTALAALFLPQDDAAPRSTGAGRLSFGPIAGLLRQPGFARMLATVSLLHASHAMLYVSGTLHWQAHGIGTATIGGLWAVGVVAEILLFLSARRWIERWSLSHILMGTGALGVVRWGVTAVTLDLTVLFGIQILHGVTYGVTHMAAMRYLGRAVPEHRTATAQALYSAIPMGLASGTALALSGVFYDRLGGGAFWIMAGFCGLAFWIARRIRLPAS
ncbi:3-phenylpropionate MFS transporter [Govanella unica]|uniref:3-phenylpropionate MFS transporter n=1 Tax=Govanella unica TaxID=2975056 RepID=A0A9X3TXA5_9PROT|nr:3-phenylpropionate MFS transporter [Govania unica]MDA5193656.1 3-phenylpropionate MFS transporter [Govania unica]